MRDRISALTPEPLDEADATAAARRPAGPVPDRRRRMLSEPRDRKDRARSVQELDQIRQAP